MEWYQQPEFDLYRAEAQGEIKVYSDTAFLLEAAFKPLLTDEFLAKENFSNTFIKCTTSEKYFCVLYELTK